MSGMMEPVGSKEISNYDAAQNAMDIHASKAAIRAAKTAKDVDAISTGIDVLINAEAIFACEYKIIYSAGKPVSNYDCSVVISAEEYCNQFGFSLRGVQRCGKALLDSDGSLDEVKIANEQQKQLDKTLKSIRMDSSAHVSNNSGENEWYTPECYIESARLVMGSIDLDPASCELANKTVKAGKYFTMKEDGLTKSWFGNVWLNPPYAQPLISEFAEKVSVETGQFKSLIVLVNNATDTSWFQSLANGADAICFVNKRIRFIDKEGNPSGAPLQGQAFLYYGNNADAFHTEFSKYGFVMEHIHAV